jgi:hypothetical protein
MHNVENCAADKPILSTTDERKFMFHFTKTVSCPNLESFDAMCSSLDQRVRQDLLWHLRWNLVDAVEDMEIATGPHDRIINMPFLSHPLANESLFDPPLSCIDQIAIRDFGDQADRDIYYPEEERYKPPAALKIENENGVPIQLRQSVTKLHSYARCHLKELRKVKGVMHVEPVTHADGTQGRVITAGRPVRLPDDIGIYFHKVVLLCRNNCICLSVTVYADGEVSWPGGMWASRLSRVRNYEARR